MKAHKAAFEALAVSRLGGLAGGDREIIVEAAEDVSNAIAAILCDKARSALLEADRLGELHPQYASQAGYAAGLYIASEIVKGQDNE